uniref:Phospholipase B1, membrane-associated n=1 Tax=Jaculus jaculus TaxID=51337 RepID=A0A8C5JYF0_JACJA
MELWPAICPMGLLLLLLGQGKCPDSSVDICLQLQTLKNFPFPCKPQKLGLNVPSTSVNTLKPSDIKLVVAIGNLGTVSISSRLAQRAQMDSRCLGRTLHLVLSDIIVHFNPSVLMPMCPSGRSAVARNLWIQAKELVRSLKEHPQLDFQHDWKLINVFFSNTSQCHLCPSAQQKRYLMRRMDKLNGILDYLRQEVPRAFVNLVELPEIVTVSHWHQGTGFSTLASGLCNCSRETSKLSQAVMQWSYQEAWEGLLAASRLNNQESFAVVVQPFFYELSPSRPLPQDSTTLALSLWNSMMEPAGHKNELLSATEKKTMKCPSWESPYLFTYKNSNYRSKLLKPSGKAEIREGAEFTCPEKDPSDMIPTTVHRLKPADIKVIGALGDSLTAGNGAGSKPGNILDVLTQYRGLSWSVGGDHSIRTVTTLANILREFNPSLKGFSVGTGREHSPQAALNQAVAGATSWEGSKAPGAIHFEEDWKLITMFIGGNDLCDSCNNPVHFSPQNFTNNIKAALDILHAEVPRAFVNLVQAIEIIGLRELYKEPQMMISGPGHLFGFLCRNLCSCVLKLDDNSTELAALIERNRKYQEGTQALVETRRYDTRGDFTVVVQPFFEKVNMPRTPEGLPDSSFFAPDCFHFSAKAHAHSASALWKNMLEPVGQKTRQHNFENKVHIVCPNQLPWHRPLRAAPSASYPFVFAVHALRPADIQVVAALGDSLTAGNGIGSQEGDFLDVRTQYRGLSYSGGGDKYLETVTTFPNILREFNGNLTGYAVGIGDANSTNAFLNQAVPGAKAGELASQVQALVHRMKTDSRVNFHQDWKVITVMIGGSDLCDFCLDSNLYSAANFFEHLRNALDTLHREVPRALVNLVDFMNPSVVRQVFLKNPDKCPVKDASALCNCVLTPRDNSPELARLEAFTRAYQSSLLQLVESGRYDTQEDFSVVLQPFFLNVQLPVLKDGRPDTSFFAPDCIHPSQKFHSQLSRALWRNMLEPLGRKTDTLDLATTITMPCPTQDEPFLRTFRNSNYSYPTKPTIENWGSDLLCMERNPSDSIPTSVHELRPADIKVVAALGDSLTTATGARPGNSTHTPWRGLSWSIGGDGVLETHTTLPNILKKFNPSILGFSIGTGEKTAGLNVAVEGARARDMPAQAHDLVKRIKDSPKINLEEDWKLVTLFIGTADLCHYCENPVAGPSLPSYVGLTKRTLCFLQLPRTFVNVVEVMELAGLHQGQGGKCAMPLAVQLSSLFHVQSGISSSSHWHQYMQRDDFAMVVQPFFHNTLAPLDEVSGMDLTFFSEDCSHFSERGQAEMAIALWNNMLEPVGQKTTSNNFTYSRTKLKCPSAESPFLYTLQNSLPSQAEVSSKALYWAVPVTAVGGLVVGVLAMMVWTAIRHHQKDDLSASMKTTSF